MINTNNLGKRIASARKCAGLTQNDLALKVGVTAQAVSKWERGECYPDITLLPRLAKILSCSEGDFFEEE